MHRVEGDGSHGDVARRLARERDLDAPPSAEPPQTSAPPPPVGASSAALGGDALSTELPRHDENKKKEAEGAVDAGAPRKKNRPAGGSASCGASGGGPDGKGR